MASVAAGLVSRNISVDFERVDTSDDLAALRHRLSNNSSTTDPLDLEVQRIFQRKDDSTEQSEAGTAATPNVLTTNHNAWSLIVGHFEYSNLARTCTKSHLQEFASNRRSSKLSRRNQKPPLEDRRATDERWLRYLEKLYERARVSFSRNLTWLLAL